MKPSNNQGRTQSGHRFSFVLLCAGAVLVLAALIWLSQTDQVRNADRRLAGWMVALGGSLLMTGITVRQNAEVDRRQSNHKDVAPGDPATPAEGISSSRDKRTPWRLWRHW